MRILASTFEFWYFSTTTALTLFNELNTHRINNSIEQNCNIITFFQRKASGIVSQLAAADVPKGTDSSSFIANNNIVHNNFIPKDYTNE